MRVETLFDILDSDFYTGVPDSQLQALCNFLIDKYGISEHHVIAANEGNCTALAAGHCNGKCTCCIYAEQRYWKYH